MIAAVTSDAFEEHHGRYARTVLGAGLMISADDYLFFVDEALNGMVDIVTQLGDDKANQRPDYPGANSPFAILTHCLGVMEFWGGAMVAGRDVVRDRDAEFRATGEVDELVSRVRRARQRLVDDMAKLEPSAPPRGTPQEDLGPITRTQGGVLLHIYEELAQHRGQMEGCRDTLLAPWAKSR